MAALNRITEAQHNRIGALFGVLLMLGPLGGRLVYVCTVILEDWAPALTLATTGAPKVHDLLVWKNKLWTAQGSGVNGTGKTLIRSYDINTDTLRTEFEVPVDTYSGLPYWHVLKAFNGELYAGLGNNQDVSGTGDVYKFDGAAWLKVLDTMESDVYALEVYNGQLYAGAGTDALAGRKAVCISWWHHMDIAEDVYVWSRACAPHLAEKASYRAEKAGAVMVLWWHYLCWPSWH